MRFCGYAAAWEEFAYPSHMEKVGGGEAILMYANGVGIIGIGRAMAKCEILKPGSPSRLLGNEEATEWRIPVEWLAGVQDERACRWTPAVPQTFMEVSKANFGDRRKAVREHFLDDSLLVTEGLL